jgi:hypothetical protein
VRHCRSIFGAKVHFAQERATTSLCGVRVGAAAEGLDLEVDCKACLALGGPTEYTAWDLIGFDGTLRSLPENATRDPYTDEEARWGGPLDTPARVRLARGRRLWESVGNDGGRRVRLSRLETDYDGEGLRAVIVYVEADAPMVVVAG